MEELFFGYLPRLTPKTDSLRLFRHIVKDVWRQKEVDQVSGREKADKRLQEMYKRKQRLVDHLLSGTVDETTCKEQAERLDAEINQARPHSNESAKEEYDVEDVMDFSERLVLNAPRLWAGGNLERRQKLQQLLFPGKITYLNNVFEPTVTCLLYKDLQAIVPELSNVG